MSKNTLPRFFLIFLGLDKILEQNFCILHAPLGVNLYSEQLILLPSQLGPFDKHP
jgi:hypothetical protein